MLIVVDVQNDFADPHGALYVEGGDAVISAVNDLVASARDAGALIVYTQDWHPATTPHFQEDGGAWPAHCVAGTWGSQLHPTLDVAGPVIHKGAGAEDGYSGFTVRDLPSGTETPTELDALLRRRHITRVVVVGLAQDVCVKETALDARRLGYDTTVVTGATRAVNRSPGDGDRALDALRHAGVRIA